MMRRLWIACLPWLAACGFHSPAGNAADASLCFDGFTRDPTEAGVAAIPGDGYHAGGGTGGAGGTGAIAADAGDGQAGNLIGGGGGGGGAGIVRSSASR